MYSNSVTVGDWETFVTKELVSYIDSHYRTLPRVSSRGLAGHSMGGYGTMRLGMKSPDVFSSIYALSPCCMEPGVSNPGMKEMMKKVEALKTDDEVKTQSFFALAMLASAAAWSPNPKKPPFFIDLPFRDGEPLPDILAKHLSVVFCGINPGQTAATAGHHFSNGTNRFWRVLHLSGFTPEQIRPLGLPTPP